MPAGRTQTSLWDEIARLRGRTSEIDGRFPPIVASAVDVAEGRFDLHRWPWRRAEYTLVVAGEQTAEITFRVSCGR